jgi:UPF0176 protein
MSESSTYEVFTFYKYVPIEDPEAFTKKHLKFCEKIGIKGRILIAAEGLNGAASGTKEVCREYIDKIRSYPGMEDTEFKIQSCDFITFRRIHVRLKDEIVNTGLGDKAEINPLKRTGKHLSPSEFKQLKGEEGVVVIDVRSNYEHELGHFKNAVRLDIDNFRDFPSKINELEPYKDKKVITYCTGGVKCEKASAFLLEQGFKDVYQLKGGIIQYSQDEGGEDFDGNCYVFDERVSVPVNKVNPTVVSKCIHCNSPVPRMLNCSNPECNEQVVMCYSCGWVWEGACSDSCKSHNARRQYDGSGYYSKYEV